MVSHPLILILFGDACPGASHEMLTRSTRAGVIEEKGMLGGEEEEGGRPAQANLLLLCKAGTHTVLQREGDPDQISVCGKKVR